MEPPELKGFWIHLDADVLDPEVMPAVDSPSANGLTFEALIKLLKGILKSSPAVGLEFTVFDPDLDPDGKLAASLADALVSSFK